MKINTVKVRFLISIIFSNILLFSAYSQNTAITYEPFIWKSEAPADCPFERSEDITGILFKGTSSDYRVADTWYFSWASDNKLYSPFTDGDVPRLDGARYLSISYMDPYVTGQAVAEGDDPTNLNI